MTGRDGDSCGGNSTPDWLLDVLALPAREFARFKLIDVRETHESTPLCIPTLRREIVRAPLSTLDPANPGLDASIDYLFVCSVGRQSAEFVKELRARGYRNVYCVQGGIEALRRKFIA